MSFSHFEIHPAGQIGPCGGPVLANRPNVFFNAVCTQNGTIMNCVSCYFNIIMYIHRFVASIQLVYITIECCLCSHLDFPLSLHSAVTLCLV